MTIHTVHIEIQNVYCEFVFLLKYNLLILVLMSTNNTHPLLGRHARLLVWAHLF